MPITAAGFADTVTDGPLLVALGVSGFVGLLSFLSPCVLPLVPGYLSYVATIAGQDAVEASQPVPARAASTRAMSPASHSAAVTPSESGLVRRPSHRRVLLGGALFVVGFSAVFVSFGAFFGGAGRLLLQYADLIARGLGVLTILMGLTFLGTFSWTQREWRPRRRPRAGLLGAPLLGVGFGVGWTPCLGPTLGAVQTLAVSQASAGHGALLALAYCVGLGIPFLLVAAGAGWAVRATSFARQHAHAVKIVGGVTLILLGTLLLTGLWDSLMVQLRGWFASTGLGTSL